MPRKNTAKARKPTTDAVEIIHRRYFEGHPEKVALVEEERAKHRDVAQDGDGQRRHGWARLTNEWVAEK